MSRRDALEIDLEEDTDGAWLWRVTVGEYGETLDSGSEDTEDQAWDAAIDARDDIEHRADIEETENDLRRRWASGRL